MPAGFLPMREKRKNGNELLWIILGWALYFEVSIKDGAKAYGAMA